MSTGDSDYGDAAIIGGAGLVAGITNTAGQIYANSQNRKYQKALNALMVNLSNTAHQREVLDLQAAGLNPILSASSSGASVPTLSAPDFANPGEGLSAGINSATKALDYKRQSAMTNSQIAVNSATAQNLIAQNENLREQNKEIQARIENTKADTLSKSADVDLKSQELGLAKERVQDVRYPGFFGQALRTLHSFTDDITPTLRGSNSASSFKSDSARARANRVRAREPPKRSLILTR